MLSASMQHDGSPLLNTSPVGFWAEGSADFCVYTYTHTHTHTRTHARTHAHTYIPFKCLSGDNTYQYTYVCMYMVHQNHGPQHGPLLDMHIVSLAPPIRWHLHMLYINTGDCVPHHVKNTLAGHQAFACAPPLLPHQEERGGGCTILMS